MSAPIWSWDDVPGLRERPPPSVPFKNSAANRPRGGAVSRFHGTSHHARRDWAALRAGHPALSEARTLFPSTVVPAAAAPRVLVSGFNSAKIGRIITKGPWRGLALYTLTLEERATCPVTCDLWRECYGNAMPLARRHRYDADLIACIKRDLVGLLARHPAGIAIRLHILGDFPDLTYLGAWARWITKFPSLRVFGFTAHPPTSAIGAGIMALNRRWPERWVIRFSVPPTAPVLPLQATTIWRQPDGPRVAEGLVCPAQTEATAACATCGLCWSPAFAHQRVAFVGHGMGRRGPKTQPMGLLDVRKAMLAEEAAST